MSRHHVPARDNQPRDRRTRGQAQSAPRKQRARKYRLARRAQLAAEAGLTVEQYIQKCSLATNALAQDRLGLTSAFVERYRGQYSWR